MSESVYVCGDSFNTSDKNYPGLSWYDKFSAKITRNVINLSSPCASNLLISLQVERAIQQQANFVIVGFTSVTRSEVSFKPPATDNLLDRFYNLTTNDNQLCNLTCYTVWAPEDARALTTHQQQLVSKYNKEFFDLNLAIYKDSIIIDHTLQRLVHSKIPFLFDQGGFEHPSYGATDLYFINYNQYRSQYNLWDHCHTRGHRPYFHLVDPNITDQVANYYYSYVK